MRTGLFAAAVCACLSQAGPSPAQTKEELGRKVLNEAVEALGGSRFLAMKDRVEIGRAYSFYRERLRGLAISHLYTRYLTAPDPPSGDELHVRERQTFGKDEDYGVLFDETKGYEITFRGATPVQTERLERYRDTTFRSIFYILRQRLREPGLIVEHKGSEVWDNQPMTVVEIADAANRAVTVYFHQSTRLPMRQVFYRRDDQRVRHEEVTVYAKYRDVAGVHWPWATTRFRDGEKIFEFFSENVQINKDLGDQLFTISGSTKILQRK